MPAFIPDTTCIVAAVCTWHASHEACAREVIDRPERGEMMVLAAHSLVEAYSVLTRLPPGRRLSPVDAERVLDVSFVRRAEIVSLEGDEYIELVRRAPERGIVGGQVYDALIIACAAKAQVDVLLTLNARHFLPLTQTSLRVVVPGTG
ncbi:MAG: PIN domain-containing protein [Chloroflexi bacterium]|nr:PIN domain-containing protein [Chloroflexota bacterium]